MKLLILACCAYLVYCQDTAGGEEPRARCTRPFCDMACPFGFKQDEYGCDLCECQSDVICPEPMCATDCSAFGGYQRNAAGCMTCECLALPTCDDIECSMTQTCRSDISHCTSDMGNVECLPKPICVDQTPPVDAECPMMKCAAHLCEYGVRRNERGCPTCECASDPCEVHECFGSQICEVEMAQDCVGITCPRVATCRVKSLCHHHQEFHDNGGTVNDWYSVIGDPLDYRPECLKDGTFHPTQCNMKERRCWCVDDRGMEIAGTYTYVMGNMDRPNCESINAESLEIQFQVFHEISSIQQHMGKLEDTVKAHLSSWLTVSEEHITVAKLETTEDLTLLINVEVLADEETDLPSAAFHMHDEMLRHHCNINFLGQNMRSDPHSVKVQPHYEYAELPEGGDFEEVDEPNDLKSFCNAHPKAIIMGCVGGSIILLLLAVLFLSMCKKKRASHQFDHRKFENYEKNLTLAGDVMKHPDLQGDEKETPVAIISVTDTLA